MAKISDMTLEERETHISQTAAAREEGKGWDVYTDDPVWIRKLEAIGLKSYHQTAGGGKFFTLPENQITLRKARVVSAEEKKRLSEMARRNFGQKATAPQSGIEE